MRSLIVTVISGLLLYLIVIILGIYGLIWFVIWVLRGLSVNI